MKKVAVIVLAVAMIAIAAIALAFAGRPQTADPLPPTAESGPAGLERFYNQDVDWERCGRYECTEVEVPVNYERPDGETLTLWVKRVAAIGKGGKTIFVNPGGPGGSGADFAGQVAGAMSDELRQTYDIVGVDPRGVGRSTPVDCLDDEAFDEFISGDPTPDDSAEVNESMEAMRQMGEACLTNSGDVAKHISTEEAARDQDVVRALLGQEQLHWYGASYGTQLGATYAELFPEKVGRMVLDGAVDVTLDSVDSSLGQAEGFNRALVSYLETCIAEGDCPVGSTVDEGIERLNDFLKGLDSDPMQVSGDRHLTESHASFGIAVAMYAEEAWPILTQALNDVFDGDPTMLMYLSDLYFDRQKDGSFGDNSGQAIYAINCLDSPEGVDESEVERLMPQFEEVSPLFGRFMAWGTMGCAGWPIDAANPQQAVRAAGAAPILVIGTTRDPATPYEWSEAMAEQLESGVLLTREGDGHTAFLMGNACIVDAVEDFYLDGTVPKDGTVCAEGG